MLCLVLFLLSATALFAQEDFSAEVVTSKQNGQTSSGKIYLTKDKVRFEPEGQNAQNGFVIINFATHTSTVLMPARKMYIEMPGELVQRRSVRGIFPAIRP